MISTIKSVLLDNSFVTRLLKKDDDYHDRVVQYFKYFADHGITMYLSTIVVSEYSVADDPANLLSLSTFRLLEFDYHDAKLAGELRSCLKGDTTANTPGERNIVINDLKIFAQVENRGIDAFITKDAKAHKKMYTPLKNAGKISFQYLDLTTPLNELLGELF